MNSRGECQSLRGREIDRGERERDTARTKQRERERRQGGGRIRGFHTVTLDSIQKSTQKSPMDRGQYTPAYASLRPPPPSHSLSLSLLPSRVGTHYDRGKRFTRASSPLAANSRCFARAEFENSFSFKLKYYPSLPLSGEPNRCTKLLQRNALV